MIKTEKYWIILLIILGILYIVLFYLKFLYFYPIVKSTPLLNSVAIGMLIGGIILGLSCFIIAIRIIYIMNQIMKYDLDKTTPTLATKIFTLLSIVIIMGAIFL